MNRENFEYLVATFSDRTRGKKYENFVVNHIWHALGDPDLRPVTQQYVNRRAASTGVGLANLARVKNDGDETDTRHAFIDLYFPQLHLGVECDEAQHFSSGEARAADGQRTNDIARVIPDYLELRVSVVTDAEGNVVEPNAILSTLDEVVEQIRERKRAVAEGAFDWSTGLKPWDADRKDWEQARDAGVLRVSDEWLFAHNGEIRRLFGRGNPEGKASTFQTNFRLDDTFAVWCPTLSEADADGRYRSTNSKGILNVLFPDGDRVWIGQADPTPESVTRRRDARQENESRKLRGESQLPLPPFEYGVTREEYEATHQGSHWDTSRRITFARVRDAVGRSGYQFIGVFAISPEVYADENGLCYRRCNLESDEFALP